MTDDDLKHMQAAIELAKTCRPVADRIPKVGAVIAMGPAILGSAHRGSGTPDDDEHAEKKALSQIHEKSQLGLATAYTTLEPCTPGVRSDPLNCCTNLLKEAGIKKVFIGILDPNQSVTGKGLWELQDHGIDVELFPPNLAGQIRALNSQFIRSQKTLGLVITNTKNGQVVKGGEFVLEGTYINQPGEDVFVLASVGPRWWVQPHPLSSTAAGKWSAKVYFGSSQDHNLTIVQANELGMVLMKYYGAVTDRIVKLKNAVLPKYENRQELTKVVGGNSEAIYMTKLPKGLLMQAQVSVKVEQ